MVTSKGRYRLGCRIALQHCSSGVVEYGALNESRYTLLGHLVVRPRFGALSPVNLSRRQRSIAEQFFSVYDITPYSPWSHIHSYIYMFFFHFYFHIYMLVIASYFGIQR